AAPKASGWLLLIHPDFLYGTALAHKIKHYEFFEYSLNESLFLSEKEERIILDIFKRIRQEYQGNMDGFSQNIIVAQIELLLNYAEVYYKRQYITRKKVNHENLGQSEALLNDYFNSEKSSGLGIPSLEYVAGHLNLSHTYQSSLTETLTGEST